MAKKTTSSASKVVRESKVVRGSPDPAHGSTAGLQKSSALVDTRVIYCGDNLEQLKKLPEIPPFEFENWAVVAFGGIPNVTKVGDMGIDGRIYPVSAAPARVGKETGHLEFMDVWYPIQVKQKDKVGRPDVDQFEAVMTLEDRKLGYFVGFEFNGDARFEIDRFQRKEGREIRALTVREILDEQIARRPV